MNHTRASDNNFIENSEVCTFKPLLYYLTKTILSDNLSFLSENNLFENLYIVKPQNDLLAQQVLIHFDENMLCNTHPAYI